MLQLLSISLAQAKAGNTPENLLNEIFQIIYSLHRSKWIMKKHDTFTDDPAIRRYVNKIENKITFRIKKGYYLEL